MERDLPHGAGGLPHATGLQLVAPAERDIGDRTGRRGTLKLESSRTGHYQKFKIWVPGAEDATRTVSFHYRAANGLRFFEDHDELYWNITGDEWDVPIEAASARSRLPEGAEGVRAIAFNGEYGSTATGRGGEDRGARRCGAHAAAARLPRRSHRRGGMEHRDW